MKTTIARQQLQLQLALFLTIGVLVLLGMYTWQKQEEQRNFRERMLLLETRMEQERKKDLLRLDSLQQAVLLQENINLHLKDSLVLFAEKRILLNNQSHARKTHISSIDDPDSLWHEVARHYRR